MIFAAALAHAAAAQQVAAAAPPAERTEIRFCPEAKVRPYPLDSLRGVQGLLLQNVAIVNRGAEPMSLDSVTIELRGATGPRDQRVFGAEQLAAAAKAAAGAKAQGTFDQAAFQFCDGRLLGGASLAGGATLQPGEALLLMQNVFAYRGSRTELSVHVQGRTGQGQVGGGASLPIDPATSKTQFRWPLRAKRAWLVGAGASFHNHHRWAVPEEFALDILAIGADGRTYRGSGARNADFHAYGADVVAAADGRVASAIRGGSENPPMLRRAGESMEAYYGRIGKQQAKNVAGGEKGISGDAVVIDHGNGEYSVYAHLKPGSVTVNAGDRVRAGQVIGQLGSSGNSTEPHLHFQLCDKPSSLSCAGIPPTFVDVEVLNADGPRPIQSGDLVRPE